MPFFNYKNTSVFYEITGTGHPLLLLPGNTASSRMFDALLELYTKNFRVILIDFPGHGQSDRLDKFDLDFWYSNANVCSELLDNIGIDNTAVIGTSGGALVAINLALEYPQKVSYIIADSFEGEYPLTSFMNSVETDRNMGKQDEFTRRFWEYNHGPDWEDIVDLDTQMLIKFHNAGKSFFHKSISELEVPALLTGSKKDEFCDSLDAIFKGLKKKNDKLDIFLFEEGGHPAMLSNGSEFYKLVVDKMLRK